MKTPISKDEKIVYICWSVVLLCAIIFFIVYHVKDMYLYTGDRPCGFKYFLHLYCPGCGGTRAVDYFLHGHFVKSFLHHPTVVYIACFFTSYYIPATLRMLGIMHKPVKDSIYLALLFGLLVLIVLHFILRNVFLVYLHFDYIGECLSYWI